MSGGEDVNRGGDVSIAKRFRPADHTSIWAVETLAVLERGKWDVKPKTEKAVHILNIVYFVFFTN